MKTEKDNRTLRPYVATILNYIKGLRTADTWVDRDNPYLLYIPIVRGSDKSYIFNEATKRLRQSKLTGVLVIEPHQLVIKVNKGD